MNEAEHGNEHGNMFKYSFVKAVFDLVFCLGDIFYLLGYWSNYFCRGVDCHLHDTPFFTYWMVYFYNNESILMWLSPLLELIATLGKIRH
jgi:hypothetical protein